MSIKCFHHKINVPHSVCLQRGKKTQILRFPLEQQQQSDRIPRLPTSRHPWHPDQQRGLARLQIAPRLLQERLVRGRGNHLGRLLHSRQVRSGLDKFSYNHGRGCESTGRPPGVIAHQQRNPLGKGNGPPYWKEYVSWQDIWTSSLKWRRFQLDGI